jgi:hypothetical protein
MHVGVGATMTRVARSFLLTMSLRPRSHNLAPGPPPEVCAEIDEAWERARRPLPDGVVLELERLPALGRAWGVLRLADGMELEPLTAAEVVAIACGDAMVRPALAVAV